MPRTARIVIPEVPHHITHRGNNLEDVFFVDEDRRVYLELLAQNAEAAGLTGLGYCLMTNHVHIVGIPQAPDSLAKAMGRTAGRYTQHINRTCKRRGHLWESRFYSCALDERHTVAAMRYIECNPVRAGIVRKPWEYPWSSAPAHVGLSATGAFCATAPWDDAWPPEEWRRMLDTTLEAELVNAVRHKTMNGRPLGTASFVNALERLLGRRLHALRPGRPW